ncbi:hypothetical protein AUC61_12630 [Pseudomonas sp. S25]|uniref:Membrane protein involved in the export of O-antigen and teichoic acid n=1 Tax=Pseudomonas maioricensis TaxID=1766623 RepID=A0ABS9ZIH1_9PSED|nr:polysaccharide biosynthesis C-terminal domain-containing protein [Pseudomonas sp. S25]MCI8210384.1 hypothetical protein [Pseudomonas sp. S25]
MSLKQIGGAAVIYTASNGFASGAQLLLLFYCAYVLPGEALGTQTLFMAVVALSSQVLGLGLVAAFQRDFFSAEPEQRPLYLSSIVWMLLMSGVVCCVVAVLVGAVVSSYWLAALYVLPVALLGALGQALQQVILVVWQSEGAPRPYLFYMLFYCGLQLVIPVALLNMWGGRWESAVYGQALVFIVGGLMSVYGLRVKGYLTLSLSRAYLKKALAYGLPLVPYQIAGWGMAMLDRFIITGVLGVAIAGYYALAFQVSQLVNIASGGFVQAFTPWLYKVLGDKDARTMEVGRLVFIYSASLSVLCLVSFLAFKGVVIVMDQESYWQALGFAPWLFAAMFFNGMYRIASSYCLYYGQTRALAWMIGAVALLSGVLNWYLVPLYGAISAAWTSCFSFALLFAATSVFTRRRYNA